MEITFSQLCVAIGVILSGLVGAIGFMFKWILVKFSDLEKKHEGCEEKLMAVNALANRLQGQLDELTRHSPADIVAQITAAVTDVLKNKE